MEVAEEPCSSCPYRKDVPPGVWAAEEYEKLRGYDTNERFKLFLCHYSPTKNVNTACRGWLTVHCESVAVRLAEMNGYITAAQKYAPVKTPLYATGSEAADAGISGVIHPSVNAQRLAKRISVARNKNK